MKGGKYIVSIVLLLAGCNSRINNENTGFKTSVKKTNWRPTFHFTPPSGWMNDPNGLVYHEGTYHLFYQHYPHALIWGPMHWGHATSTDLISWEHQPIALFPDKNGYIFSGSVVVDHKNSSGLGKDGKIPLVALFTYFQMEVEKRGGIETQTQGMAYSLDAGNTWEKYDKNPILPNPGIKDFRDPKVFWHQETQSWKMLLVAGNHLKIYQSTNLKDWVYLSEFGRGLGAQGGVWECPDMFPLRTQAGDSRWVLLISVGNGGPNGGSGTQYFVGDFDGVHFSTDQKDVKWLDWGTDNYAGVTYNGVRDKRIFIGWMSNWQYALKTPTSDFRSAMTLPRELELLNHSDDFILTSIPIIADTLNMEAIKGPRQLLLPKQTSVPYIFNSVISLDIANKDFKIRIFNQQDEEIVYLWDATAQMMLINRSASGVTDFHYEFGNKLHYMVTKDIGERIQLDLIIDRSSSELFLDNGKYVSTTLVFPKDTYQSFTIENLSDDSIDFTWKQKD